MATSTLDELKAQARAEARAVRARLAPGDPDRAAGNVLAGDLLRPGLIVSGYVAIGDEIDPAPLMAGLAAAGVALCLPVVAGRGRALVFRGWRPGDRLVEARFGLREPAAEAPELVSDLLIVPLLAFDRRGGRLGYGGGLYDRTLAALRQVRPVLAVGLAYAGQEVAAVPVGPWDEPLDWVATDAGLIRCR